MINKIVNSTWSSVFFRKIHKGNNVSLSRKLEVTNPKNIYVGDDTYINGGILFPGIDSKIEIGRNCLISYNVHIRTTTHNYDNREILIGKQGSWEEDIVIEDDVWIGFGAQILPGVTIKKGAVIGAGAVVTKDVDQYSVVGGIPARVIGLRK